MTAEEAIKKVNKICDKAKKDIAELLKLYGINETEE